jgi:hypothetical protein
MNWEKCKYSYVFGFRGLYDYFSAFVGQSDSEFGRHARLVQFRPVGFNVRQITQEVEVTRV